MDNEAILQKLRYKPGAAVVLNAPDGYGLGVGNESGESLDFLLLYVHNAAEANEWLSRAAGMLKEDAVFWIAYPKSSSKVKSDLNRDSLNALVQNSTSYRAVSNVAVDEKWSALRFRRADLVKSR
ncbi:hypothetical protein [Paenibacillus ginsengarvi]|uniref:DUF3052 domain-containing protein n=1 Tax=Paenibacillus ginsengarvi TaxID=400777 RepID=A0A3B0C0C6_9BACL|nr:hypothetical protein [Paenibacillus ginsengarvi]RKN79235.1 hypothetical protein D7M11_21390 [Paenibacillus ginsengarvi]